MARYEISYSRSAVKSLRSFHPEVQRRLRETIEGLGDDPYPPGSVKLAGGEGERRVRVGDYRIIYDVDDGRLIVLVLSVGHRRDIYRG